MRHDQNAKLVGHTLPAYTPGHMLAGPVTSRKAKNAATPLCYVEGADGKPLGHIWQETSTPTIHVCTRCKLVQYKSKKGHWKNAASVKDARNLVKRAEHIGDLWSSLEEEETEK